MIENITWIGNKEFQPYAKMLQKAAGYYSRLPFVFELEPYQEFFRW